MKPKLLITTGALACVAAWFLPIPGAVFAAGILAMCLGILWACHDGAICHPDEPRGFPGCECPTCMYQDKFEDELASLSHEPKEYP